MTNDLRRLTRLHKWLITRSLSLDDALIAIESSNLKIPEVAARIEDYLIAEDFEPEVAKAAFDRLLDVKGRDLTEARDRFCDAAV
jgi:hypothetical protein